MNKLNIGRMNFNIGNEQQGSDNLENKIGKSIEEDIEILKQNISSKNKKINIDNITSNSNNAKVSFIEICQEEAIAYKFIMKSLLKEASKEEKPIIDKIIEYISEV